MEGSSQKRERVTLKTVLQMLIEQERKRPQANEGECLAGLSGTVSSPAAGSK